MLELQKALEIVNIKLPGHEVRELIRQHDTNVKDGKLDMVEFGEVSYHYSIGSRQFLNNSLILVILYVISADSLV